MKTCTGCHQYVARVWYLDGTKARYCAVCIGTAVIHAYMQGRDAQTRRLMLRYRP
jgi:hypothetical protein